MGDLCPRFAEKSKNLQKMNGGGVNFLPNEAISGGAWFCKWWTPEAMLGSVAGDCRKCVRPRNLRSCMEPSRNRGVREACISGWELSWAKTPRAIPGLAAAADPGSCTGFCRSSCRPHKVSKPSHSDRVCIFKSVCSVGGNWLEILFCGGENLVTIISRGGHC